MAAERFQYRRDWVKKAFKLPWFAVLAVAAKVIPKKAGLWVFGRRSGFGDGPLALLNEVRRVEPSTPVLWLTRDAVDEELARANNVPYARYTTFAALWACLRASFGVITHGFSDLRGPAIWGAQVIQLWHGTPLKRVGNDMGTGDAGFSRKCVMVFQKYWNSHLALVVAGSDIGRSRLVSSLGVPAERVQVLGDPRCDLIERSREAATKTLYQLVREKGFEDVEKLILYAPTWRESAASCLDIDFLDARDVDAFLTETRSLLVIRDHPYSGQVGIGANLKRAIFFSPKEFPDLTATLAAFDMLITDYSSVAMDFATLGRPIVFLAPDLAEYSESQGLYEPYERFSGGRWCANWRQTLNLLSELRSDEQTVADYLTSSVFPMRTRYNQYSAGGNSARVLEYVRARAK